MWLQPYCPLPSSFQKWGTCLAEAFWTCLSLWQKGFFSTVLVLSLGWPKPPLLEAKNKTFSSWSVWNSSTCPLFLFSPHSIYHFSFNFLHGSCIFYFPLLVIICLPHKNKHSSEYIDFCPFCSKLNNQWPGWFLDS